MCLPEAVTKEKKVESYMQVDKTANVHYSLELWTML